MRYGSPALRTRSGVICIVRGTSLPTVGAMVEGVAPGDTPGAEAWRLKASLTQRCAEGQVPAVVLGDLTLVRPVGWAGIPVVAVSPQPDDVAFRSRYVDG